MVREAGKRVMGMRHFDVQLMGGQALHEGNVAEMRTGEGKTLVATLPVYLNALSGEGVHVVTVNDYLAKRDAEWMARSTNRSACRSAIKPAISSRHSGARRICATSRTSRTTKSASTICAITWRGVSIRWCRRKLHFAIVDEVDSILIDEARHAADHQRSRPRRDRSVRLVREDLGRALSSTKISRSMKKRTPVPISETMASRKSRKILGVTNLYVSAQPRADASTQCGAQGVASVPQRSAVHRQRRRSRHRR